MNYFTSETFPIFLGAYKRTKYKMGTITYIYIHKKFRTVCRNTFSNKYMHLKNCLKTMLP